MNNKELFLVYTDIVGSTPLDQKSSNPIAWRKTSFLVQLKELLSIDKALALKSIGDALFIIIESKDDKNGRIELCKEILAKTYQAYILTKSTGLTSSLRKEIKIRAVVHLITGHRKGKSIADSILKGIESGGINDKGNHKSKLLIDSLKKDIFGTEVNKAARIQSLVKDDAILITEEIAKIIESDERKYNDKLDKLAYITFEFASKNYKLHAPVPIIKLKGMSNINCKSPIIVWQLDEESHMLTPTLATEFKSDQMLRLLMTKIDTGLPLTDDHEEIHQQVFSLLRTKDNNSRAFDFYNNFIWDVIDRFNIFDIRFTRPSKRKQIGVERIKDGDFFNISQENDTYKLIKKKNLSELLITQISFSSFPSREIAVAGRAMFESENPTHPLVNFTEPQTIDIFKPAKLEFTKPDDNSGYFILLFFGLYIDYLKEANEEDEIFKGLEFLAPGSKIKTHIRGLNSGLVDGFVLFKVLEDSPSKSPQDLNYITKLFEQPLNYLLNKYKSDSVSADFFSKTFPVTVFLLKNFDTYHETSKVNIDCLIKYREMHLAKNGS